MNRRSWLLMALLAGLWGASYLFIKVALEDDVPPIFLVFARIALGAAVLVPLAWRSGALRGTRGWTGPIVFMALIQVVIPFLLITYGEQHIASSLTGILVSAAPIFTALIAVRYDDDERPHGIAIVGVAMGIVGVVLLFGVDLSGDSAAIAGGLMVLLATVGYAVGSLYLKHRLQGVPAVGIAAMTMLIGALVLVPPALVSLPPHALELKTIGSLVALGAGGTGLAFAIYYTLIAEIGPGRATVVAYIAPGFSVLYGVTLLGERFTAGTAGGLALILAGSWLAAGGRLSRSGLSRSTVPEPARAR
jgi:drug/metabolite transporter (DMT)-like permease